MESLRTWRHIINYDNYWIITDYYCVDKYLSFTDLTLGDVLLSRLNDRSCIIQVLEGFEVDSLPRKGGSHIYRGMY